MSFPARFQGWCPRCKGPIAKGETVRFNLDDEVQHIGCEKIEKRGVVIVCNECWLEHPCGCEPRWQMTGTKDTGLIVKWVFQGSEVAAQAMVTSPGKLGFTKVEKSQV